MSLGIVDRHATVLVPSAVVRLFRDLEMPGHGRDVCSFGQQLVGLSELANHLLGRVPSMLHGLYPLLSHHGGQEDSLRWIHSEGSGQWALHRHECQAGTGISQREASVVGHDI